MYAFCRNVNGSIFNGFNQGIFFWRSQIQLKQGWGLQVLPGQRSAAARYSTGFCAYSPGFKKDFANKKGSIGFAVENFMTKGVGFTSDLSSDSFKQSSTTALQPKFRDYL
ncbi:outer membrane beta-barrel protein [Dyadobacter sp. CY312]|uniref:outer membrane beta-barrel protein n=1 Tax=Dyadobacter sp. CY312 TaxID=2907303 RepID=UPI0038D44299